MQAVQAVLRKSSARQNPTRSRSARVPAVQKNKVRVVRAAISAGPGTFGKQIGHGE
jgi:hypothetical protein